MEINFCHVHGKFTLNIYYFLMYARETQYGRFNVADLYLPSARFLYVCEKIKIKENLIKFHSTMRDKEIFEQSAVFVEGKKE